MKKAHVKKKTFEQMLNSRYGIHLKAKRLPRKNPQRQLFGSYLRTTDHETFEQIYEEFSLTGKY